MKAAKSYLPAVHLLFLYFNNQKEVNQPLISPSISSGKRGVSGTPAERAVAPLHSVWTESHKQLAGIKHKDEVVQKPESVDYSRHEAMIVGLK